MPLFRSPQPYVTPDGHLTPDPEAGVLPPSLGGVAYDWMASNLVFGPGDLAGKPYEVPDHFIEPLFRMYEYHPHSGRRVVSRVLIGIGKGNSKTEFASAVGGFEFAGPCVISGGLPELRPDPSVVMGAASYEQADLVYGAFRAMTAPVHDLFDGPYDRQTFRKGMPGLVERVAAKAGTNDGKRPTCVVADEFHEWTGNIGRNHLVLTNGLSKRSDSLELNITTAGSRNDDSMCLRMYEYGRLVASGEIWDPGFLFFWWEAPENTNYEDAGELGVGLREANPAGWIDLGRLVKRASEIPEFEHRRYHGNQWTQTADAWMTEAAWDRKADPNRIVDTDEPVVLMFDGSYSNDSAAIVGVTVEEPHHVFVVDVWENPAFLLDQPNNDGWRISDDDIDTGMSATVERFNVVQVWYDPWGYHKLGLQWENRWAGVVAAHNTAQVGTVVAPACSMMYSAVHSDTAEVQVTHDGNPTLKRHVGNAVTKETPHGKYIVKDGPNSPRKIDAAYAATMGLFYAVHYEPPDDRVFRGSAVIV